MLPFSPQLLLAAVARIARLVTTRSSVAAPALAEFQFVPRKRRSRPNREARRRMERAARREVRNAAATAPPELAPGKRRKVEKARRMELKRQSAQRISNLQRASA